MLDKKKVFNLNYYLTIILRRKWFFIIPLLVVYIASLFSLLFLPKIYEARAIILVEEKSIVNPLLKDLAVTTTVAARLNTLKTEILSWPRLFQLVERLGLSKGMDNPIMLERLIAKLRNDIVLKMHSNEVISIVYRGENPKKTQDLVNTLCDIIINRNISSQMIDTQSAVDFITEQLNIYKNKLEESEKQLREFKEIYGLGKIGGVEDSSPSGVTLSRLNQEIANLEADLVMLSIDCTDEHPRVKSIKSRIGTLKEERKRYIEEVAKKVGVDPKTYVSISDSFPRQQEELARITRDKAMNERIYAMLLERLETARITESLDNSDNRTKFRIVEPARLPLLPVSPNKIKINLLGLMLGGFIGVGFVYLREYTDSSINSEDELKSIFTQPILGNISKIVTEEDIALRRKRIRKTLIILSIVFASTIVISLLLISIKKLIS
ncbi:MAG: Wzz/FepE/Etk N-terminal domain-containing protein [Candidatus Omnitrophica bacterium]|nr:Wzz/FepE/Etk N-terminal domain-containing protein [Candidatus Omnitrophota bacterium]MCM8826677.1 Wzz/FepE/Etk N-terminal domain-containing protein [Candidatus Omnitrophota bacterium]